MADPLPTPAPARDDNKVVELRRDAPTPATNAPDDFETRYKARRDADDEVKTLRERAARADDLEREREQLETLRTQAPPVQRTGYVPQPPPQPGVGFDINRWRELARIDPGAAYMQMEGVRQRERQAELAAVRAETANAIMAANRFQSDAASAHERLRAELPEVFDGRSNLQKRAVEIYNSDPWYQSRGDGHLNAAFQAAAELGIVAKSKRRAESSVDVERDSSDQNIERGTRKPQRRDDAGDGDAPLSTRDKKIAEKMGLDERKYRTMLKAKRDGKDVRVS